jgi:hypothetical protein
MWYERHQRKLTLRENRNRTKEKTMDYQTSASKYLVRTYGIEKGAIMLETDTTQLSSNLGSLKQPKTAHKN